jgi:transcriptional regulator with XRE-family HTH domain
MASAKSQRQMGIADRAMPFRHHAVAEEFAVTSPSPTVRRRELGARLRALRVERDLTVEDVAERMEVSPAKISRIETAARGISLADVRFLCDLYGVSGADRERLLVLSRESRRRSWWQEYGLPDSVQTYIGLEDAAVSILQYKTSVVPPLLQTEDYARAYTPAAGPWLSDDEVEQFVQARMTRQELLGSDRPPDLWAIIDEGALHRIVGSTQIMREQLAALIEGSRPPHVTLQVIGLEAGAHPGVDSSFTLLRLEDVSDVVYIEGLIGNFFLQSQGDLARYRRAFDHLQAVALSPKDSRDRIASIAAQLQP